MGDGRRGGGQRGGLRRSNEKCEMEEKVGGSRRFLLLHERERERERDKERERTRDVCVCVCVCVLEFSTLARTPVNKIY